MHSDHFTGRSGPGDQVPGGPAGAVFAADGYAYRRVCTDPTVANDVFERTQDRMLPITIDKSPHVTGLTGLETWVWYLGQATVDPFQTTWTDPVAGVAWILEARAWINHHDWDYGDGETSTATTGLFGDAITVAGDEYDPAGTHTYRTTSHEAGFDTSYPFTYEALWVGEWRWWSSTAGAWSTWVPMNSTFTDTATIAYEVVEIRASIIAP